MGKQSTVAPQETRKNLRLPQQRRLKRLKRLAAHANERQVGGTHYKTRIEHWDWAIANELDYMQGQATKYIARYKKKNGLEDLQKARHFVDKMIEVEEARLAGKDPFQPGEYKGC